MHHERQGHDETSSHSAGISNASIHNALVELLGKPIGESRALFIPTAIYYLPAGPDIAYQVIRGSLGDPV